MSDNESVKKVLEISVGSNFDNDRYPNLISMYDPSDPDHTVGDSDYFEDQLDEMLLEAETNVEKDSILREKQSLSSYDRVIIH